MLLLLLLLVPEQLGKYPKNMVGAYKVAAKLPPLLLLPLSCWYRNSGVGALVIGLGLGVGTIKAGGAPPCCCCCWYQNGALVVGALYGAFLKEKPKLLKF